jgi:hypothetical protein
MTMPLPAIVPRSSRERASGLRDRRSPARRRHELARPGEILLGIDLAPAAVDQDRIEANAAVDELLPQIRQVGLAIRPCALERQVVAAVEVPRQRIERPRDGPRAALAELGEPDELTEGLGRRPPRPARPPA